MGSSSSFATVWLVQGGERMNQYELLDKLRSEPDRWFTLRELRTTNVSVKVHQLEKHGLIEIRTEPNRTRSVKIKHRSDTNEHTNN